MSWGKRLVVLIILFGILGAALQPQVVVDVSEAGLQFAKVSLSSPKTIPLSSRTVSSLERTAQRLASSLHADLLSPGGTDVNKGVWNIAQALVASKDLIPLDAAQLSSFLRNQANSSCSCWKDPANEKPRNVVASSWVLYALADLGIPSTSKELEFLLKEQNKDGWWSTYPVYEQPQYASTYGTSWSILALANHLSRGFIPLSDLEHVQKALQKGAGWLMINRIPSNQPGQPRWKDYPFNRLGKTSESLSGLVLHALHRSAVKGMLELDRQWLTHLQNTPPGPLENETNHVHIETRDGGQLEYYIHVRLPWLIVATVDAYPNGTVLQRVKALSWLEKAISQEALMHVDTNPLNWWRAEILLSLQYVLNRTTK